MNIRHWIGIGGTSASALVLAIFVFAVALPAFAAPKNPVVDVSGLVKPGLYQTTQVSTSNGKSRKPVTTTECLTAAELRDYFNAKGGMTIVKSYQLHGNHLSSAGEMIVAGKVVATTAVKMTFDNPTHMHGVLIFKALGKHAANGSGTMKFSAHRIGSVADCKKAGD